jgi:flagella basal body P-ring formation protein FlgA
MNKRFNILLSLLLSFFACKLPAESAESEKPIGKRVELSLLKETAVNGHRVYLGDIATCNGDATLCREISGIDVSAAPNPGRSLMLAPRQIAVILEREWPETTVSFLANDSCKIIGANAEVRPDDVRQKLQAWINNHIDYSNNIRLTVSKVMVPYGSGVRPSQTDIEFPDLEGLPLNGTEWLSRNMSGIRMTQFRFVNPKDHEDQQTAQGQAHFILEKSMPTAVIALAAGTVVEAKDIKAQWIQVRRGPFEFVESNDLIVGRKLRQMVPAGEAFSVRMLEMPNAVSRNQPVTMIVRNGGVEITAKATTVDAGTLGQVVEVVNVANKKRMRARVIDQQTVEAIAF